LSQVFGLFKSESALAGIFIFPLNLLTLDAGNLRRASFADIVKVFDNEPFRKQKSKFATKELSRRSFEAEKIFKNTLD
jgi:hypothetical protein